MRAERFDFDKSILSITKSGRELKRANLIYDFRDFKQKTLVKQNPNKAKI